jgi:hypothetical protein
VVSEYYCQRNPLVTFIKHLTRTSLVRGTDGLFKTVCSPASGVHGLKLAGIPGSISEDSTTMSSSMFRTVGTMHDCRISLLSEFMDGHLG